MSYRTFTYQKREQVGVIGLFELSNDPLRLARLSDELTDLRDAIAWDEEVKAVLLAGAGERAFSIEREWNPEDAPFSLSRPISRIDRPVVAAVEGDVAGMGLELVLACDLRIASEASRFGFPGMVTGNVPCDGGTQRLPRLVGSGKALGMILTGGMIGAQEAHLIGLVNRVVPARELLSYSLGLAKEIASKGPIALSCVKEAVREGMDMTLEQGLRLESDLYLLLHTTRDRTEGIRAFRERRSPRFEGA